MTKFENPAAFSRRALLKTGGALVVSIGMPMSPALNMAARQAIGSRHGEPT